MKKSSPTIALTNVYKRFGDLEAVSDVTVRVDAGEVIGFVGPNGAGKTTTISMMMGFIRPTKGRVELLGKVVEPESAHKLHADIGYVAGDMVLPSTLTGKQFLAFQAAQNGSKEKRVAELMHQLHPVLDRPIKTLSRGNKQKLALFAALQHDPKLLILDEPTSGLDPLMQDMFLGTIRREAKRGVTVFMSSHILSEVSSVCSRIVFMRGGKFIVDKPITAITEQLGKHVVIRTPDASKLAKYVPSGAVVISHTAHEIRLTVTPETLKPFMRWVLSKNFSDITIEDRDLDDVFHELYTDTSRRIRS
jgi:ABC-2 type transport system ATP-binding protein